MKKILIIGAGAMGSAFSIPCIENNNEVTIIGSVLENDFISSIKSNKNLHPSLNVILPNNIKIEKFENFKNLNQNSPIKYIPFSKPAPARSVGLLFRKTSNRKTCFQNLAGLIQKIIQKEFPLKETMEIIPVK